MHLWEFEIARTLKDMNAIPWIFYAVCMMCENSVSFVIINITAIGRCE